ncbi:MAG TPA: sodium:solute symporter family protein [Caldithrix abyssi]|uniref:Sodium:solute symporter family protein n=1 Tax=Caldithrix abyssi TaxID=187145 RepID=A0A7V4TZP2_CALAY|nr:sodium:solute symporter family protein [Caldithrix abyssi]
MLGLHYLDILAIGVYFLAIIVIGLIAKRQIKGKEDYFMGGRKLGKFVSVFLAFGSGTSADTAISASRETYRAGMSGIWIQLLWLFITPFYWIIAPWYRRLRVITGGDYFYERFGSKVLTGLYVGFSFLFLMFHIAVALTAIGKTVEILTVKQEFELNSIEKQNVKLYNEYSQLKSNLNELNEKEKERFNELEIKVQNDEIQPHYSHLTSRESLPVIALIIIVYGVLGGLFAAAWTDTLQGVLILVLSLILLPSGLQQVGWFSGMHDKVPATMFNIISDQITSEYTWYYILILILMNLVGVISMPHFFATGGGSAKNEMTARIGLVAGNYLKRFTSIMWGLTGVMAFALFGNVVSDPDMIWGYATRQLLGPGLVGVMIACLLAAVMSSADAFMVGGSALFTRNFYEYIFPDKKEAHYVFVGRIASAGMIIGAVVLSFYFNNILSLIKYIWQLPVIFGTVFWLSLFWRRLTKAAAITTVAYSFIMIVVLPNLLPEISWVTQHKYADIIVYPNLFILHTLGINLSGLSVSWLMTINYAMQISIPFILLFVISYISTPPDKRTVDLIFAKLNTPVSEDKEEDERQIEQYLNNPQHPNNRRLFPHSEWEINKPDKTLVVGFLASFGIALAILGFAFLISRLTIP